MASLQHRKAGCCCQLLDARKVTQLGRKFGCYVYFNLELLFDFSEVIFGIFTDNASNAKSEESIPKAATSSCDLSLQLLDLNLVVFHLLLEALFESQKRIVEVISSSNASVSERFELFYEFGYLFE